MGIVKDKKAARGYEGPLRDFIAPFDIIKDRPDGTEELVAAKGTRVPFNKAIQRGLLNRDGSPVEFDEETGRLGATNMRVMDVRAANLANVTRSGTAPETDILIDPREKGSAKGTKKAASEAEKEVEESEKKVEESEKNKGKGTGGNPPKK